MRESVPKVLRNAVKCIVRDKSGDKIFIGIYLKRVVQLNYMRRNLHKIRGNFVHMPRNVLFIRHRLREPFRNIHCITNVYGLEVSV